MEVIISNLQNRDILRHEIVQSKIMPLGENSNSGTIENTQIWLYVQKSY